MATPQKSPVELLVEIIKEHAPEDIWQGSPLIGYRSLGNTNRGAIGEEFVKRYLSAFGIIVTTGRRTDLTDMVISGAQFEVKTVSLGANQTFQFNHVRIDRSYAYLLCIGICPNSIVFEMWTKAEVRNGEAGSLVMMAQDQDVTYKITKRLDDMRPISELLGSIQWLSSPRNPN